MNVVMTIRIEWEKPKERLHDFKKKVDQFKEHVAVMQIKGWLPRGAIKWEIGRAKDPIVLPPAPENPGLCLVPIQDGQWFVRDM